MKKKKLGQESAFPMEYEEYNSVGLLAKRAEFGMSKRLYIAIVAMQGMIANNHPTFGGNGDGDSIPYHITTRAYEFADEMLRQENDNTTN